MLRSGTRVQLFVAFTFVGYITAEYTIHNNGWIPVSPDKVYDQIRREFVHASKYHNSKHNDGLEQSDDPFSLLEKRQSEIGEGRGEVSDEENLDQNNKLGPVTFQQKTNVIEQDAIYNMETIRKAKKLAVNVVNREVNDVIREADQGSKENTVIKTTQLIEFGRDGVKPENVKSKIKQDSTNVYEVTENPKADYMEDQNNFKETIGHHYNPHVVKNLTSMFFDILSKYNIKENDKLQNYRLSRLNKVEIPVKEYFQVPRLIPYRYNSPNHMPIDPLFAVFLSNYGVYLSGMYGIKSNYNNLYGYLASNNIHNNKPFGLYKVYSDTDSSN